MQTIRKILVPIDFSEHSARALDTAIGFAKTFGAEIELVHSYEVTPIVTLYGVGYPETLHADLRKAAIERVSSWLEKVHSEGVAARQHVVGSPPVEAITEIADEVGADLIVMGTRGNRGLKHVMLGSVAERTIRFAKCPVLTVKDGSED